MTAADRPYWDRRASELGRLAVGYTNPAWYRYEEVLRWRAVHRLDAIHAGQDVLEVGCGVGAWSVRLAALGCAVTATDISAEMIARATPVPGVRYQVGAIHELDFPGHSFDSVLSVAVLQHVTDDSELARSLENLRRMLRPSGMLVVVEYSPTRDSSLPTQSRVSHMRYRTLAQWTEVMAEHGFRLQRSTGVRYAGHRLYLGGAHRLGRLGGSVSSEAGEPTGAIAGALRRLGLTLDLTLAQLPISRTRSDNHAMLFIRQRP